MENSHNIIPERFRLCYKKKLDIGAAKHKAKFSLAPTKVTSNCRLRTSITLITSVPSSMQCYGLEMLISCCVLVVSLLMFIVTDEKARNGTRVHPTQGENPGGQTHFTEYSVGPQMDYLESEHYYLLHQINAYKKAK